MTQNKRLTGIVITVVLLLLIPFIAMQFSDAVNWSVIDFITAGGLLLSTGLACEFAIRKVKKIEYRVAVCFVILLALLVIWVELAVGIFGSPIAGS